MINPKHAEQYIGQEVLAHIPSEFREVWAPQKARNLGFFAERGITHGQTYYVEGITSIPSALTWQLLETTAGPMPVVSSCKDVTLFHLRTPKGTVKLETTFFVPSPVNYQI